MKSILTSTYVGVFLNMCLIKITPYTPKYDIITMNKHKKEWTFWMKK